MMSYRVTAYVTEVAESNLNENKSENLIFYSGLLCQSALKCFCIMNAQIHTVECIAKQISGGRSLSCRCEVKGHFRFLCLM